MQRYEMHAGATRTKEELLHTEYDGENNCLIAAVHCVIHVSISVVHKSAVEGHGKRISTM